MGHRGDVLVVGAGPIGLALACHLRRLNLSVRLVEKRAEPSIHSKAIGLQYRVSEILARLGIVDRFIARGGSPSTVNLYATGKRLLQLRFVPPKNVSGRGAFAPRPILIPQSETERILIDYFQELGGTVEWNTELLHFRQSPEEIVANVQYGGGTRQIVADWLVSCEGAHSLIRKQAGMTFLGKTHPLAFFMADVPMEGGLQRDENHVWLHEAGSLAALPLPPPGLWRLFIEVTRQREELKEAITLDDIRRFIRERAPDMDARISGEPIWLSDFRISCRMVDRMHIGRVFLAGDAAHIHSPTGGQGITTGMQDAVNLAWKLARVARGAPAALLDTYNEERLRHAAEVLRETERTTNIFFAPNLLLRLLRDRVVLPILRSTWVQQRMFGKLSQLHVHYRASSLSRGHGTHGSIRPGDRAPDVAFSDTTTGQERTLFELMATFRPIVLYNGVDLSNLLEPLRTLEIDLHRVHDQSASRTADGLVDLHGDFGRLYGLKNKFLCLIRPDGHMGLVQVPPRRKPLVEYLALICDPQRLEESLPVNAAEKWTW